MMREQHSLALPVVLFLIFVLLHVVPVLSGDSRLWGVDQWRYAPRPLVVLLLLFGLLVIVPRVRRGVMRIAGAVYSWKPAERLRAGRLAGPAVLLAAAGLLFWGARNATHFLGDGYLWASHLRENIVFNEPVTSWLYRGVFRLLNSPWLPFSLAPETVAALMSIASGLAFLVFAYKTVQLIARKDDRRIFCMLALLSSGMMLLFFGYVEPYPPFAASVMAFTYYGIGFGVRRAGAAAVVVALAAALLLHFSAIALIPSVVLLFWMRNDRIIPRKKYYASLVAGAVIVLAVLSVLKHERAFSGFFYEHLAPLLSGPSRNRIAYPVLSFKTVFDSCNQLMLICPIAIFIVAGFLRPSGERRPAEERVFIFLETMAVVFIAEFIVFNKNIGVSRDWDLFAPIAIPLALLAALVLLERYGHAVSALSVFVFAILVVHTAPWIGLNSSREKSIDRFVDIVHDGFWSSYARGYGYSTLGIYFRRLEDMQPAIKYTAAAAEADPGNTRYLYNLGELYQKQEEYAKAAEVYEKVIERKPDYIDARYNLGVVYWTVDKLDLAERAFSGVLSRDSTYYASYEVLMDIYLRTGRIEECVELYRKAERQGRDMGPFLKGLCFESQKAGEYERSRRLCERMLETNATDPELHYLLGMAYFGEKRYDEALALFREGMHLDPSHLEMNVQLGLTLQSLGKRGEALEHLLGLYERNVRDLRVMSGIGAIYNEQGRYKDAIEICNRASEWYPANPELHIGIARASYRLGDFAGAWDQVAAAERLNAKVPDDLLRDLNKAMARPAR